MGEGLKRARKATRTVADAQKAAKKLARAQAAATTRQLFFAHLAAVGLPLPEYEFAFHATRDWRFDYAWPAQMVALEVDGGIWTGGRHTRGAGWLKDTEKLNTAASMGWRLLRTTPDGLHSADTLAAIRATLDPHHRGVIENAADF
jgi:hypothetical protein